MSLLDPLGELLAEAAALAAACEARGATLRLLGGVAVKATCPSSRVAPFARACADVDFVSSGMSAPVEAAFAERRWSGDREFNLYNGDRRLIFHSPSGLKADVFVGSFRMCHMVPLDGRLGSDDLALPLAELLLTKLQVFEICQKDLADAACILADHETGEADGDFVNTQAIASACAADWGLWRTVGDSLGALAAWMQASAASDEAKSRVAARVAAIQAAIGAAPKSLRWKARSAVGDRMKWYELPEEVER